VTKNLVNKGQRFLNKIEKRVLNQEIQVGRFIQDGQGSKE
jgi:hypothetical protein